MRKLFYVLLVLAVAAMTIPVGNTQAPRDLPRLMKAKLKNAQVIMEGMALADYAKIRNSADELIQLTKTEEWMVHKTPRYEVYSNEFRRSVEAIAQKAKEKNIDGVALAYVDMTLACVRCHQYVRELRDVQAPIMPQPTPLSRFGTE